MPLSSLRNSFRRKNKPQKLKVTEDWLSEKNEEKQIERKTSPHHIFSKVGDAKALWSNKFEAYAAKQASNPFSDKYVGPAKIDKNDPNYGRPDASSLTAQRARDGEAKLRQEVCDLCDVIFNLGTASSDGKAKIQFGELFQIYSTINDKVVGLLLRARKRHLLIFEGEMLFQRRDDDKWITLTKNINSIHAYFGRPPDVVDGGEVDYDDPHLSEEIKSASSYSTLESATAPVDGEATLSESRSPSGNDGIENIEVISPDLNQNIDANDQTNQKRKNIGQNEISVAECELKVSTRNNNTNRHTGSKEKEPRKPKLSFRFRSNHTSKPAPNSEEESAQSTSPGDLSVPAHPRARKKSVMAALFDNLPILPPQHVSTATMNLKKKTDGEAEAGTSKITSAARRISLRLKSRRKSEAPVASEIRQIVRGRNEQNKPDGTSTTKCDSQQVLPTEVQKSKSFDDNAILSNSIIDELEPNTTKEDPLSAEAIKEDDGGEKIKRKASRRASIAAAAATARHTWEQMKNAAPTVNRMSLKSKNRKEGRKTTVNEKPVSPDDGEGDNNNDANKELGAKTGDVSDTPIDEPCSTK